uniref:Maturase K n=1 Tax=Aeginetia indica TaxID=290220 RepID=A0A8F2YV81_9LAMI|nr:maturase K [Aeginetia indica]WRW10962.1 maturase K [Aeginetia indica]
MDKSQKYLQLEIFQQKDFLYTLFFQEYTYAIAHDHGFCRSFLLKYLGFNKNYSLLIAKRVIMRMYQHNYFFSQNYSNQNTFGVHNKNFYYQILSEGFAFSVEIPFYLRLISRIEGKNKKIVTYQNLRSIHSLFPFLEDNFYHLNLFLYKLIPYSISIHAEILVKTFRYWVKDASSLHLLRFFINFITPISFSSMKASSSFCKIKKKLVLFLYNYFIGEYESIFVFLFNKSSHLRLKRFIIFLERIYFFVKIECLVKLFIKVKDFQANLWLVKEPCIHYIRYQNKNLLASKGTSLFMKKWQYLVIFFFQCHFSLWFFPKKIKKKFLSKHSFEILGFFSSFRSKYYVIRSQSIKNSFIINNVVNKVETCVSIIPLLGALTKAKFCNVFGHPISKPNWADFSYYNIINLFGYICRNISHYHSGASSKKNLYQIKYILKFSCVLTLARKHKSTVRTFLKKKNLDLIKKFFMSEEDFLVFTFKKVYSNLYRVLNRSKFWYLDTFYINDLSNNKK